VILNKEADRTLSHAALKLLQWDVRYR